MLLPKIFPVTCHTDRVGKGSTFVVIQGFKNDGTKFIQDALEKGATHIVLEKKSLTDTIKKLCQQHQATYLCVNNTRQALAQYSSKQLNHPSKKLKIIGITGTKGKTTTTFLTEHILRSAGHKTALISTIYNKIINIKEASSRTTPESDYLHMFFAECVKKGVEYVIMEVSAHALSLHRVYGIQFDAVGFTNLASEHMDFYATLDDYFSAKTNLFLQLKTNGTLVINKDNEWGKKALGLVEKQNNKSQAQILALSNKAQNQLNKIKQITFSAQNNSLDGINLTLNASEPTSISCPKLFGTFNGYNIAMATLICQQQGIPIPFISKALKSFQGIPGRLQHHVLKNGAHAFVDYAHNASSIQEVLKTLRSHTSDLIVIFGCGGDRDTSKRPIMGKVAARLGDKVILTDDNPRFENPKSIIKDILTGIPKEHMNKIYTFLDRREAIKNAAQLCKKGSIIAILGKGHETYHSERGEAVHLDDFEEIRQF